MRDERTFIRVHDDIENHPKIAVLSDKAYRVLTTTWGLCSRQRSDGLLPLAQWRQRGTPKARKELETELVHRDGHDCPTCPQPGPRHVVFHDYLQHQRSAAEIEAYKAGKRGAGRAGAHARWHSPSKADPDCPQCVAEGWHLPSQKPSQQPSQPRSQTDGKPMPETETETEKGVTRGGGVTFGDARGSRPPDHCDRHPGGTNDPCRACADARRSAEEWDADDAERRQLEAQRKSEAARERAELRAQAIAACDLCDDDGYRGKQLCDHDPAAADRARRGAERARAALRKETA